MDTEALQEQLGESKKMLYMLGAVLLFAVYMLWPSGGDAGLTEEEQALEAQLAALQEEGADIIPRPVFSGTDNRGISVGGGGGFETSDPSNGGDASFQTTTPRVRGILVGFGTKIDTVGEYLVAYVYTQEEIGYEIDLREIVGYSLTPPDQWVEGEMVAVYGAPESGNEKIIIAEAIQ